MGVTDLGKSRALAKFSEIMRRKKNWLEHTGMRVWAAMMTVHVSPAQDAFGWVPHFDGPVLT